MVLKNAASYRPDWSKQRNLDFKINNAPTYCNDIMQYLFILICCQLFCRQQQATSRTTTYQYTVCLMVAVSVHFNKTITLTFTIAIQQWWKELCNTTVQYWREAFYTLIYCYLKKPSNGGVQPGKKLLTTTCGCYQSLHSIRSPAVMLQCCVLSHSSLNHVSCLPFTDYKSLDHVYDYGTLCITMFANWLSDVVLLLYGAPTRLLPVLSLDLLPCSHNWLSDVVMYLPYDTPMKLSPMLALGLFPCSHDRLYQIKSCGGAGRQASDRNGGNGKRTQSESSKQSGSAGSNTNSSTARGACYTVRTGLGGVSGGTGDSSGGDDEDDKDRRWYLEKPWDAVWKENGDEDDNENCSTDAASKDTPGENKGGKEPHVTAESTVYEFSLKCGDYLYMFGVTSEMKYKPLPGDKLENLCAAKRSVTTTECSYESYHDKLLYSDEIPRTWKNLKMLCLRFCCYQPSVLSSRHSAGDAKVSIMSLLPPPGGGNDEQFKEVLMIFCTIVAAVYCLLYDDHCYFDRDDLHVRNFFVMMDVKTAKITSVSIHALPHQLGDVDREPVRAATNEGLRSLAGSIYSQYQHTQHEDLADGILAKMRQDHSYQSDLDMLHSLLVYHDACEPFTNNTIAFMR